MSSSEAQTPAQGKDDAAKVPSTGAEDDVAAAPERFAPEEEAELLNESNEKKTQANALFSSAKYENAINKYEEAASVCPHYLDYELAVLQSNISACHLKLEQWKDAIGSASKALEGLNRLDKAATEEQAAETEREKKAQNEEDEVEEEIVSSGAQSSAPLVKEEESEAELARRKRKEDIARIRAKALMRRARARSEQGGWANLSGAEEDYKLLSAMENLSPADRKIVTTQLRLLPPRSKAAQEKEMAEMWGKLKDLGNGILKPFGLSTDNFKMDKDEKSGGYSMNFKQG
ncbi:dihydroneopterin aldolase family protein [Apiospora arundinis]